MRQVTCMALLCGLVAVGTACGEAPIYASSSEVIFNGSIYYSEAGCASCHGVGFDGNGPQARTLSTDRKLTTPGFTGEIDPTTTPLSYFKVITAGTEAMPDHAFQSYTDRGRWAMANFLFSLAAPLSGDAGRAQEKALSLARQEARAVYARQRRWHMGYKPIGERPASLELKDIVSGAALVEEGARADVSAERVAAAGKASAGRAIYQSNCASCHGLYAEGGPRAARFGLIPCEERQYRDCGVYQGVPALNNATVAALRGAHAQDDSQLVSSFASLSDGDWEALADYVGGLAGK